MFWMQNFMEILKKIVSIHNFLIKNSTLSSSKFWFGPSVHCRVRGTQWARKYSKVHAKKLVKSNKSNIFSWNCIFGSFKLFPSSKIDFWPFLKLQKKKNGIWSKKNFCLKFDFTSFLNFLALCESNIFVVTLKCTWITTWMKYLNKWKQRLYKYARLDREVH